MGKISVVVLVVALMAGCASYNPGVFPVGQLQGGRNVKIAEGAKIYVNVPAIPARAIFSCDLEAYGLRPVYISITNNSDYHYRLSRNDISGIVPAEEVAEYCDFSVLARGGIFPPTIARVVKVNGAIKHDYISKELPEESIIEPGQTLSGIVFIKRSANTRSITGFLNNLTTNSRIQFEVDLDQALTKSNFDVIVGEKYFTQTNLHLTDGETVYSDNYLSGKVIPLGTEVIIISADEKEVRFRTGDGKSYKMERSRIDWSLHFEIAPELFLGKNNPLNSERYKGLADKERLQITLGRPEEGMSKEVIAYTLGHSVSQESPYFDGIKWSYWVSKVQPLYIFFDTNDKVLKIHEGPLIQNEEYAIRVERYLRGKYNGALKSTIVVNEGPPSRTISDASGGEIFVYDNYVPVKEVGAVIRTQQYYSNFTTAYFSTISGIAGIIGNSLSTTSGTTTTTVDSGYTESMRVSFYTGQTGSVYLIRCDTTRREGRAIKYENNGKLSNN